ncbi:MAG: glutathione S-transferase [Rubrobacteraceae bacterium]|uniref:glutathione S-transferase family protein n=1 Tax=Rubrobacter naiadicus TaxID=1392641 RepID=UPI0023617504|nr:glutathione S-transferase [Rubrobacter naiadicus]MBX6762327.1 glutathione S-transferase [Rubrobacteraceae bacterium]
MLRVWGRNNSINVQKVLWCCEELSLEYERVDAGGPFGRTDTPEYRRINPTGLVPAIEEDGFTLWESNAIVRYLARRYGSGILWPWDPQEAADADRWMDWQQTTVWAHLRPVFLGLVRTPEAERDEALIEESARQVAEDWRLLDEHLREREYVCGDSFTAADIPLGVSAHRWFNLPIERPEVPGVEEWYGRLLDRGAFRKVVSDVPIT